MTTMELLKSAKGACSDIIGLTEAEKNIALENMAQSIISNAQSIIDANKIDIEAIMGKISPVMIDRLRLDKQRIEAMAQGIRDVAKLCDPCGEVISNHTTKNGLIIQKTRVPMGVVAIIYESRPNVTSDAAALCFKSSNVCVLRGGKEAINSNKEIVCALHKGLQKSGLSSSFINLIEDTSRESANELMTATGLVDLLIPRGGKGLISACVANAKVPCIQTGTGICHIYVEKTADFDMALDIIENAKTSRPSVCNAAEVLLCDNEIANKFLPLVYERLVKNRKENPVELVLDKNAERIINGTPAEATDFDTEFLDYKMAVGVVDGVDEAISHINKHSTSHSEAIITSDKKAAQKFTSLIDSSSVYVNASTRFTDGGEFGLGCEMGISTQKLHARGPMGLCELTSYKYIINGNGQIR